METTNWLRWAQDLQAIAQNGLAYSENPFDRERFEQIRVLAAEITAQHTGMDVAKIEALFMAEEGAVQYATPKVDVRGAIFQAGKILLVRENMDGGRWTLPGGWADMSDSPSQAVLREVREETGYEARTIKLAAVYDRRRHGHPPFFFTIYKLFFLCEITGGSPVTSYESGGVEFFALDQLPELSISRVTAEEIAMLFQHHAQPDLPTIYD